MLPPKDYTLTGGAAAPPGKSLTPRLDIPSYRAEGAFRPTTVTVGGAFQIDVRAIRYALWARIKKNTHNRSS